MNGILQIKENLRHRLTIVIIAGTILVSLPATPAVAAEPTTAELEALATMIEELRQQVAALVVAQQLEVTGVTVTASPRFDADDITAVDVRDLTDTRSPRIQYEITLRNDWRLYVIEGSDDRLGEFLEKLESYGYRGTLREFRARVAELDATSVGE